MRTLIKTLLVVLCLVPATALNAQNTKIGYINSQELLAVMPETIKAQEEYTKEAKAVQEQLEIMQVELNNKYENYLKEEATLSDPIKRTKQEELQQMQQRIQNFQADVSKTLKKKEADLFQPIMEKAQTAIKEVAKENNFTIILPTEGILYFADTCVNILPLVKKKLGITDAK